MLTKIRSFAIKGGSQACAGLSALCTSRETVGWGSALGLPPWGQLALHRETGFYITFPLVTSAERESQSIANRPFGVWLPLGSVGFLGLLLGPQRKVSEWIPRSARPPLTWTSAGNGG